MQLELVNEVRTFNRATRQYDVQRYGAGSVKLSSEVEKALKDCARDYRLNVAQMASLALSCYFGDGADHLSCEHCDMWRGECAVPERGGQTTIPLLDKGIVVVGLSTSDQGV